jgi:hypothetical protein
MRRPAPRRLMPTLRSHEPALEWSARAGVCSGCLLCQKNSYERPPPTRPLASTMLLAKEKPVALSTRPRG